MITRTLSRRLERLEAELAPPSDEQVLMVVVTSIDRPDEVIELRWPKPKGRRRRWQWNGGRER